MKVQAIWTVWIARETITMYCSLLGAGVELDTFSAGVLLSRLVWSVNGANNSRRNEKKKCCKIESYAQCSSRTSFAGRHSRWFWCEFFCCTFIRPIKNEAHMWNMYSILIVWQWTMIEWLCGFRFYEPLHEQNYLLYVSFHPGIDFNRHVQRKSNVIPSPNYCRNRLGIIYLK